MGTDQTGHQSHGNSTAGVIARPPLLYLGALLFGAAVDHVLRWPFTVPISGPVRWTVAGVLILIGIALFIAGIRNFVRAETPVPTNQPTLALVTTGIHGWTRNPIYLSMLLVYGGLGAAAASPWILILTLPLAATIRYGVIAREEAYLERRFGDAYRDYKARVHRWL